MQSIESWDNEEKMKIVKKIGYRVYLFSKSSIFVTSMHIL
jgi:hypothetical protein